MDSNLQHKIVQTGISQLPSFPALGMANESLAHPPPQLYVLIRVMRQSTSTRRALLFPPRRALFLTNGHPLTWHLRFLNLSPPSASGREGRPF